MTSINPLPIRLAQTVGITSSLVLAGMTLSTSITTVPRLLESPPSLLLQQWGHMYNAGKRTGPPISILASLSYFFLAYRAHTSPWLFAGRKAGLFVAAGVLSVGIVPYTFAVLMQTNRDLLRRVEVLGRVDLSRDEMREMQDGEKNAHQLVDKWALLNLGRAAMLLASGLLGVWGVVG
ncbi:hypothetical protein QTJ16_003944 [Diplocarpon rosae]|uniref:DUF1772-domain-containing protein n=1 Tax=Diplocarpon rosae TaxID=946125 RepID=A0AAD9T1C2_9HELO|nr:hypothetical protein QTJ16_003944 [Diplocarpon rosae]PBP26861.1 hypothetical protein BUE80_DR002167 [Diplocarpon rosae]